MNKVLIPVGGILLIAVFAFLYVQARNANSRIVPTQPKQVQLTPTAGDSGTALRGPSRITTSPNTTPFVYPTSYPTLKQPIPTAAVATTTPTKTPVYPTGVPTIYPSVTSIPTQLPTSIPTTIPTAIPASDPSIINFTSSGFSPSSTTVRVGTWVTFRNYSTGGMKISGDSITKSTYPNFGERTAVGQYGFYQFRFTNPGNFSYRNDISPSFGGIIYVIQ